VSWGLERRFGGFPFEKRLIDRRRRRFGFGCSARSRCLWIWFETEERKRGGDRVGWDAISALSGVRPALRL
jgi:hypothetical protein